MPEAFPLLRRCHLFVGVADNEVKDLAAHFQPTEVAAEEFVFKQGEPGDGFYIIQSGQVEITAVNPVSGKTRKISTLVEGDYFGEMALVRRGARSASVKALKALKLFKLTNEEFDQFVLGNPKIKPNLELVMRARAYARKANFKWLLPNEIVYVVTLRHPVFLLGMMWLPGLVILAAFVAEGLLVWYNLPVILQITPLALLLGGAGWAAWNWVDFHNDWYVVTNQRVVDIDKVVLFYESRAEAPLPTVQNTAIKTTELGRQLNFGNVVINTFSGPITFHNVPYPQATADMILEQLNRTRTQQKVAERQQLKSMLRQAVGIEQSPVRPGGGPPASTQPTGRLGPLAQAIKNFSLRVREQKGDSIVYHKHPIVLFGEVSGSIVGILLTIAMLGTRLAGYLDFINVWMFLGIAVVLLIIMINHVAYEYFDWKNDIYMVTASQIVDVQRKPFGDEQRKAANLDAITNISYVRPGLIYQLLNYGTVTINAGPGGEMKFFDVYDPLAVQQDIYRRREAQAQAKATSATKQRVEELGQYMAAFYEVMEDERKKRDKEGRK